MYVILKVSLFLSSWIFIRQLFSYLQEEPMGTIFSNILFWHKPLLNADFSNILFCAFPNLVLWRSFPNYVSFLSSSIHLQKHFLTCKIFRGNITPAWTQEELLSMAFCYTDIMEILINVIADQLS